MGCGGTLPWQGPSLSCLEGLGGGAGLKSAALGEAALRAPAGKYPWKNNNHDDDDKAIPCCQRAAVNQGAGGARSSAHLDALTQPRGVWDPGGLSCLQRER